MDVKLTQTEAGFLLNLVKQVQVNASAPDAAKVVAVVTSVVTKLEPLTAVQEK